MVIVDSQCNMERAWHASVGTQENWSVLVAKLIAIHKAIMIIQKKQIAVNVGDLAWKRIYAVVSDSKSALQSI